MVVTSFEKGFKKTLLFKNQKQKFSTKKIVKKIWSQIKYQRFESYEKLRSSHVL